MAGLVFGAIAPHGDIVIPELAGKLASITVPLTEAMKEAGRRIKEAQPDTIVVLTPHGVRVRNAVCVMTTDRAAGTLEDEKGRSPVQVDMAVDAEFGRAIAERAAYEYGVPVATAIYGSSGGDGCVTPLDWGAVVPLWFMGARWNNPPQVVSVTPSRSLTLQQLYDFGIAIAEVAEEKGKRVALIASADWGHAHLAAGPYGYDPASAKFDAMVVDIIRADKLDQFLEVDIDFADEAKIDGLWQAITLAGAIHHTPLRGEFLAYQAPTYFGMLVAAYSPADSTHHNGAAQ